MYYEEEGLRRRLQVLKNPIPLSPEDVHLHQKLICWLEDAHIRRLPIGSRADLRRHDFQEALREYLSALGVPQPETDLQSTVCHLVDIALRLHYSDDTTRYNTPQDPWMGRHVPLIDGAASSDDVINAVTELTHELGMPAPMSAADGLYAIAEAVETENLEPAMQLDAVPLGFSSGDANVDRAAKILRLLYVKQLRETQDEINDIIAAMQRETADPRTDSKLGKVGR